MNASAQSDLLDSTPEPNEPPRRRRRWLRVAGWIGGGLLALLVILFVAAAVVLHSAWFHNYALKTAQTKATETLGAQVELQNFTLSVSGLSVDLYGLTVHGANPYPNPPLLLVQHAAAGVRVVSILHGKWYLSNFEIDRPVIRVFTDANGKTNIPTPKSSGSSSSNTSIFDLAVRHAAITNGEVYYNDKKSMLAADLHDVEFRAGFDPTPQKYSGSLRYADGHLTSGTMQTIAHNFSADFDATPSTFHLTNAKLSTGGHLSHAECYGAELQRSKCAGTVRGGGRWQRHPPHPKQRVGADRIDPHQRHAFNITPLRIARRWTPSWPTAH